MKRILLSLSLIAASQWTWAQGLQNDNGPFIALGAGVAPIYVDTLIQNNELSAAATALTGHTSLRLGWVLKQHWALYAQADHNWYQDSDSQANVAGISGAGLSYLIPDFYNLYLFAGAGLANKTVLGGAANGSGTGFNIGYGLALSRSLALEVSYSHFTIDSLVANYGSGDSEATDALNLRLSISWH